MSNDLVTLRFDGRGYAYWRSISVRRGIDRIAGDFQLDVLSPWRKGVATGAMPIKAGGACSLAIGGETMITGYIDAPGGSFNDQGHGYSPRGRDATGQLVDCTAENKPPQWSGVPAERIIADIAKPFGIPVTLAAEAGLPLDFALQPGEKAFEAIDRICRLRSLLPYSDGAGGLILGRPGRQHHGVVLRQGVNIKEATDSSSVNERFSEVRVIGQAGGFGDPGETSEGEGRARDNGVGRYRPLTVIAEATGEDASFQERAQWEVNTRAGRSTQIEVKVVGWRDNGTTGRLWQPNWMVGVDIPYFGITGDLLIASVHYTRNDKDGSEATLTLPRPEAFLPGPPKKAKGAAPW